MNFERIPDRHKQDPQLLFFADVNPGEHALIDCTLPRPLREGDVLEAADVGSFSMNADGLTWTKRKDPNEAFPLYLGDIHIALKPSCSWRTNYEGHRLGFRCYFTVNVLVADEADVRRRFDKLSPRCIEYRRITLDDCLRERE